MVRAFILNCLQPKKLCKYFTMQMNGFGVNRNVQTISHPRPKTYQSFFYSGYLAFMYYLSFIYFGYVMVYFNSIPFHSVVRTFGIDFDLSTAQGIYTGILSFGASFGCLLATYPIRRLSRKYIPYLSDRDNFLLGNSVALIAGGLVLIPNMWTLLLGRLIQGLCLGFFSTLTPMTVKEVTPIEINGLISSLNNITIAFGFLLGFTIGYVSVCFVHTIQNQYLLPFGLISLIVLIQLIWVLKIFPYETPKYLVQHRRIEEAKSLISQIYKEEYRERILLQKMAEVNLVDLHHSEAQKHIGTSEQLDSNKPGKGGNSEKATDRFAIGSCIFLLLMQQYSGINIVVVYSNEFAANFLPNLDQRVFPVLLNLWKFLISIIAAIILMRNIGRKKLLVFGTLCISASLYLIAYGIRLDNDSLGRSEASAYFVGIGTMLYIVFFVSTLGPVMWIYVPELIQPETIPFLMTVHWLNGSFLLVIFPILREHSYRKKGFWMYAVFFVVMLVTSVVFQLILIEPKDKNEIEIEAQIHKKKKELRAIARCCQSGDSSDDEENAAAELNEEQT